MTGRLQPRLELDELAHLVQKPRIDVRARVQLFDGEAQAHGVGQVPEPVRMRCLQRGSDLRNQLLAIGAFRNAVIEPAQRHQSVPVRLQGTERLVQGLLESPSDGHGFADGFHLRGQGRVGAGKFFEGEARDLEDHVIDRGLKRRFRYAGDVVGDLVERVADGQLGGDLCDGEAGGFRGQRRAARDSRVHLDDHHFPCFGMQAELDVGAAGVHPDLADDPDRGVPHDLVFLVGQRHGGRHGDAVAGMDAHRIEVLDRADDHDVVLEVPHDLQLEFLPADDGLFDKNLADRAHRQAPVHMTFELFAVVGDVPAGAAHGERRADDGREPDPFRHPHGVFAAFRDAAVRHPETDALHGLLERLAVLRFMNGCDGRADQLHIVFCERAALGQADRRVERRLSAHRRQQRIGPLTLDDLLDDVHGDGLDIGPVRQFRVGHDGGRIAVDENDPVALFPEGFAGLRARIVEFAGLPDHDRAGSN